MPEQTTLRTSHPPSRFRRHAAFSGCTTSATCICYAGAGHPQYQLAAGPARALDQSRSAQRSFFADATIFVPPTIIDKATYTEPAQLSQGMKYVFGEWPVRIRRRTLDRSECRTGFAAEWSKLICVKLGHLLCRDQDLDDFMQIAAKADK